MQKYSQETKQIYWKTGRYIRRYLERSSEIQKDTEIHRGIERQTHKDRQLCFVPSNGLQERDTELFLYVHNNKFKLNRMIFVIFDCYCLYYSIHSSSVSQSPLPFSNTFSPKRTNAFLEEKFSFGKVLDRVSFLFKGMVTLALAWRTEENLVWKKKAKSLIMIVAYCFYLLL